jgi:hypothetical protein
VSVLRLSGCEIPINIINGKYDWDSFDMEDYWLWVDAYNDLGINEEF